VGVWRCFAKIKATGIETTYFAAVTAAERKAVDRQAARYQAFLDGSNE
jgi:hypothetical protein